MKFLAMLAHELRDPLWPIRNALHILGVPGVGKEIKDNARRVAEGQVRHMARLINDLLDVSRVTRGNSPKERQLKDVIGRVVEAMRPTMEAATSSDGVAAGSPCWRRSMPPAWSRC